MINRLYNAAFRAVGQLVPCDPTDALVIAGAPRSGTTWLLEVLQGVPGYKALNEPLLTQDTRGSHGFRARSYITEGKGDSAERVEFLSSVLAGQVGPDLRWAFREEKRAAALAMHIARRKMLVKFCRINRMLPWFGEHFGVRGLMFVVRHPCAVVNSMLRFGWERVLTLRDEPWSPLQTDDLPSEVQRLFAPIVDRVQDRVDALAVIWCMDHYIPLLYSDRHPWLIVPYERMALDGRREIQRLADAFGFEMNPSIVEKIGEPSSSVKGSVAEDARQQIATWKTQMDSKDIDRVMSIVDECGLSALYDSTAEPNYVLLNTLQAPQYQW